jgi:membrane protease YdiL (CAAX protease family)
LKDALNIISIYINHLKKNKIKKILLLIVLIMSFIMITKLNTILTNQIAFDLNYMMNLKNMKEIYLVFIYFIIRKPIIDILKESYKSKENVLKNILKFKIKDVYVGLFIIVTYLPIYYYNIEYNQYNKLINLIYLYTIMPLAVILYRESVLNQKNHIKLYKKTISIIVIISIISTLLILNNADEIKPELKIIKIDNMDIFS